jgi:general secretion pathway protein N
MMMVVVGLIMLVAAVLHAPATWLDDVAARTSAGRIRLAQASGTIWQGQAYLLVSIKQSTQTMSVSAASGTNDRDYRADQARALNRVTGLVLPEPLRWRINPFGLLAGGSALEVSMQGLDRPLRLAWRDQTLQVPAGQVDLPRLDFAALGSPWNSLQPSARLQFRWSELLIATHADPAKPSVGRVNLVINDLAARISPVQPLGSYDLAFDLGSRKQWTMKTLEGVLDLRAAPEAGRGIRIEARPQAAEEARLRPLLSLMGTREADATVMRLLP